MMKAVMSKSILRALISRINIIQMEDIYIEYDTEGWRITAQDSNKVAIVDIMVWATSMESYDCEPYDRNKGDVPQRASLSSKKFIEAVSVMPDDGPITISDDGVFVQIYSGNYNLTLRQSDYYLDFKRADLDPPFTFELDTTKVEGILTFAKSITDEVWIKCNPDGLYMTVVDDVCSGVEYHDPDTVADHEIASRYDLNFIASAIKGMKGTILVSMDSDYPVKFISTTPITTSFYLAPRVRQEEAMS